MTMLGHHLEWGGVGAKQINPSNLLAPILLFPLAKLLSYMDVDRESPK